MKPLTDPQLECIENLVDDVRHHPQDFPDAQTLASRTGMDATQLDALLRLHYHISPAHLLRNARLAAAKRLLLTSAASSKHIAGQTGYASHEAFEKDFLRLNALRPTEYRKLKTQKNLQKFTMQLPAGYTIGHLMRSLGRDPYSVTERLEGDTYTCGIRLRADAHTLQLDFSAGRVAVWLDKPSPHMAMVHGIVTGLLGLEQDTTGFAKIANTLGYQRLIEDRTELRLSQTHSFYTGLLWTVIGQQINMPFAQILQSRLIEKTGARLKNGLFAPPLPEAVAALEPADLLPLQFSRQKADYVVSISRLIASGELSIDRLPELSATRVQHQLLAIRGLGPWSVNYLMMRALGFADCLPIGDTGVTSGVIRLFDLQQRPDKEEILRRMAPFSPCRSLATAHLWQLSQAPTRGKDSPEDSTG